MIENTSPPAFHYHHRNPYHQRLEQFSDFVLRDHEGEQFAGQWNAQVFQRSAPLMVEIGAGYGDFMAAFCQGHPEVNFVGIDYRFKRSYQLANRLQKSLPSPSFVRYLRGKGERLGTIFGPAEVQRIFYFFPDPWPKTRHLKKRLFQAPFLQAAHRVLAPQGEIWIKTDHDGLFTWMQQHLEETPLFAPSFLSWDLYQQYPQHFLTQNPTKFEKIFLRQQVPIKAMILTKL